MLWAALLAILLGATPPAPQPHDGAPPARISYTVDASEPASGVVTIQMRVEGVARPELELGIPVWRPGSYRFQNYPERVREVTARDATGRPLEVRSTRRGAWVVVSGGADPMVIEYRLEPGRRGDRGSDGLTQEHHAIDGPGTYLFVREAMDVPHRASFLHPPQWRVATGLDSWSQDGQVWYGARDYDTFVDGPVEISDFRLERFEEDGTVYEIVLHGATDFDVEALVQSVRRVVRYQTSLFGGAPFQRYVFIYHIENRSGAYGLEHLNSTTISIPAEVARRDPRLLAPITAHEFFHAWNVKRIRPRALGPFDYTRDVRVRELWFCEGVTSYYTAMTMRRTGLWSEEQLLEHLAQEIRTLETHPARDSMSVEEASWSVWDEGRDVRPRISYYNKGLLIGLLLDLEMRRRTGGRVSLDDLMSFLYRWYVLGGPGPIGEGFAEGDLVRAVLALTGHDFSEFFARYVAGVEPLPYHDVLGAAGYVVEMDLRERADFGLVLDGTRVRRVTPAWGPAAAAGIEANDEIVAVDGERVGAEALAQILSEAPPGLAVTLRVRRGHEEQEVRLVPQRRRTGSCRIRQDPQAPPEARALREAWLEGR